MVWTRAGGRVRGWVSARATPVGTREAAERMMKPSRVRWPLGATRRFLTLSHWPSCALVLYKGECETETQEGISLHVCLLSVRKAT